MSKTARARWTIAMAAAFALAGVGLYRAGVSIVVIKVLGLAAIPAIWLWLRASAN